MLVIAYYSNPGYKFMVDRLHGLCSQWGLPFLSYSREWLETTEFYRSNRKILDVPKGNGYWIWKPYIIKHSLETAENVIYLDSSVIPYGKSSIMDVLGRTTLVGALATSYSQKDWTKRSCFRNMGCDEPKYWNSVQVWAGVVTARREGTWLIDEWLVNCTVEDTVSDAPSSDNFESFVDHRHDQSILTNLLIKYKQAIPCSSEFVDVVQYS